MRDRVKFLRRPLNSSPKPPAKRQRSRCSLNGDDDMDSNQHEKLLGEMVEEMSKKKKKSKLLCDNMEATFIRRQKWILESTPCVSSVLETYPALKHPKVVSIAMLVLEAATLVAHE